MFQNLGKILSLNILGCMWGYMGMHLLKKGLPSLFLETSLVVSIVLMMASFTMGFFKASFVLKKTANRLLDRVERVKSIFSVFKILDLKFFMIIGAMMGLAFVLKLLPGFELAKATLRTTVGFALLQSCFYFFRPAFIYGIRG